MLSSEPADDREVMPLPLSHSFGLGRLRVMALAGHCLLLMPGMRNPAAVLKQVLARGPPGWPSCRPVSIWYCV